MAFADDIRTTNYTREELADLIDGTLIDYSQAATQVLTSTTSSVVISASATVTVPAGAVVLVFASSGVGCSTVNSFAGIRVLANSSPLSFYRYAREAIGSTSGQHQMLCQMFIDTTASGSTTYEMELTVSGSGTAYSDDRLIMAIVFRQ